MASLADDLKRIAMSAELMRTLSRAAEYAQAQAHDQIQLEHLLLALSEDADAAVVLTASHVDANLLKADVSQYLGGLTDHIGDGSARPNVAPDLKRILEAAAAAAAQGRRRDINGAIVLAAIVGDGRSPSAHMLRAQGLTFDEAIRALQRAIAQPSQPVQIAAPVAETPADGPIQAASAEDAIAAARQRVRRSRGIEPQVSPRHAPAEPEMAVEASEPAPPPPQRQGVWHDAQPAYAEAAPDLVETGYAPDYHSAPPADDYAAHPDYAEQAYATTPAIEHHPEAFHPPAAPVPVSEPDFVEAYYEPPHQAAALPQPARPRGRPPMPEPGSRWPAPVAPAWREAEVHAAPPLPPGPQLPPPLPYGGPSAPDPYAPALPASPSIAWDEEPHQPPGFSPAGVHPIPIEDAPSHHIEPSFAPEPAAPSYGGPDINGPAVHPDQPSSRPKRGRKQTDAAARALGEGLPRRLKLGVPATVEARLPKSEILALASALSGTPGRAPQPGLAMSVRLRAPDGGIVIDASSSETHWFDARPDVIQSESAHWQWTVTAVEPGRPRLQLIAAVRATGADGITGDHMLPDTLVDVRVRRGFGWVLLGLVKWAFVAGLGAGAALYGPALVAAVQKLIK